MTRDQLLQAAWDADEENRNKLQKLLDDPVLQNAFLVLESRNRPNRVAIPNGPTGIADGALEMARLSGYFQVIDDLRALTHAPLKDQDKTLPEPWSDQVTLRHAKTAGYLYDQSETETPNTENA